MSLLSTSIPERVLAALDRVQLRGAGMLVAFSGGLDSTCLLHLLAPLVSDLGGRLEVAHVDHGLRPGAAQDAQFCAEVAAQLGLPYHLRRLRPEELRGPGGTQARARSQRRRFFEEVCRTRDLAAIALGHHADDQVETVLFRLLRGAGPRGLSGIREWAPPYFRPLLQVRRAELEVLAREEGWSHREDPTNRTGRYARNRIRREALPLLRSIHPGTDDALLRLARLAREEDACLSGEAVAVLAQLGMAEPEGFRLDGEGLRGLPRALRRRVYLAAWEAVGLDPAALETAHLEVMDSLLEPGRPHRRAPIPGPGSVAVSYGDVWFLRPGSLERPRVAVRLTTVGRVEVPELGVTARCGSELPPGAAGVPVARGWRERGGVLRTREPGDRIPSGIIGRDRKVKDLLMEARIPAWRRHRALVVLEEGQPCGLLADGKAWGGAAQPVGWVWIEAAPVPQSPDLPEK